MRFATALAKYGPSHIASSSFLRRTSSCFRSTSTSPVPWRRAATNRSAVTSRSFFFRFTTSLCAGQGKPATSSVDLCAKDLRAVGLSCSSRSTCSRIKKPQSWALSC